jgi:hypothetical protein
MALVDLWLKSPDQLRDKQVAQIIAFAGDGRLRDDGPSSTEFRDYLSRVPSEVLDRYASECLSASFPESGQALQDIVNQVGSRLGFGIVHGRYRGTPHHIGFDGLWQSPSGHSIVVEVKTTDAYRIDLNTLAGYRKELVSQSRISEPNSSILIIVGRQDTGDLEAQIRGSRHAWDVRLISVGSLLRLMFLKEDLEDPEILHRVHQIIIPREFTRLDEIVDILFSTAEDLKEEDEAKEADEIDESTSDRKFTPVAFHRACVDRISRVMGVQFVKRSRASFHSSDNTTRLVCAVSREHRRSGQPAYWFAFHPHQSEFLLEADSSFVAFGCGSPERVLLIPFADFEPLLDGLNTTEKADRSYWHVPIVRDELRFNLLRRKGRSNVNLTKYVVS